MAVTTPLAHAALLSTSVLDSGVLLTPFTPRLLEHLLFSVGFQQGVIRVVVRKGARHFIVSLALALMRIRHLIMPYRSVVA